MGVLTMKDVAGALGVSVTSVSNAFNKPDRISKDLRERIVSGAAELGYFGPDAAGRVLRSGKANAFGVVFNEKLSYAFTDPYAVTLLAAFTEVLEAQEMSVTLLPVPADPDKASAIVNGAVVDGVLGLCAGERHAGIAAARRRGLRFVLTDYSQTSNMVSIDDRAAGLMIGKHIAGLGHERVALVYDAPGHGQVEHRGPDEAASLLDLFAELGWEDARRRLEGMLEGLAGADVTMYTTGRNLRQNGTACAAAALDAVQPTAIIAVSDLMALGVLDELRRRGLEPGGDVSVTGFDGLPEALAAGLTTIIQPVAEKGRRAAELLLSDDPQPQQILLPVEFHLGRTTAPPRSQVAALR